MELLGAFYRRKLRRKQKRSELGRSDGALCKTPSETSVNSLATGLISKVLRFTSRRSEPGSRPHSWHSTKLGEGPLDPDSMMQISQGAVGAPWHQSYHSSASTTDLSGYDAGFLRKSPDQYSSRGSMESLDPPHPAYSSCNQLSASKSTNSIDHLHSKRDSAYSSFSTSSSIPEYLAAAPSFSKERSYSMESVPQHRISEGMQQADIRYVRTVYDPQQGVSEEHEVSSAALLRANEMKAQSRSGSVQGGICHRANSSSSSASSGSSTGAGMSTSHRHSVGPVWGQPHNHNSYENLKGAPAPPLRSDSFAAIRNHERPNSWSSLEHARSLRSLHKGSWHHSSGSVASGKASFGLEGQLHTVIEKSPESSPTIKPKQSFPPSSSQPGRTILPTGVYPVPQPEPHFAQIPTTNPSSSSVYPALAKESNHVPHPSRDHCGGSDAGVRMAVENGYQSAASHPSSGQPHASVQPKQSNQVQDDPQSKYGFYRSHLQPQCPSTGPERRDPFTPVQSRGERPRYSHGMDVMESYRQPREEELSRFPEQSVLPHLTQTSVKAAQGQVAQLQRGSAAQAQGSDHKSSSSGRHHSDSSAYQQRDQDADHPLTRLENALAEVQRCASPQSSTQSERGMSVLEKISHFERQQSKPRSHSSLASYGSSTRLSQVARSSKSSLSGLEDLQNISFPQGRTRSASAMESHEGTAETQQDFRTRYGSNSRTQPRKPHDLHRSKSSFQLGEENGNDSHGSKCTFQLGEENLQDIQWRDDVQDILGTSFNRTYRDSIKDAQSKVLRSTSFRRRDLSVNPPPVPVKHMSLERKGPKTSPKPTTSPHTPKERHVVPVEVPADMALPPELPSVPPVGPPVMRICGRKRLTTEQKKLSYSEPENMHEVGISDQESGPFQRKVPSQFLFPDTSVADRRRMFELASNRGAGPKPATSRPDLKQMQQEALAEYVERKTGRRMDGRPHRPHSAYMQSASSSSTDSHSLTSTPSLCSLQDLGPEGVSMLSPRQSSTLTSNMQRPFYPNRGAQVQPHLEMYHLRPQGQSAEPQRPERSESERPVPVQVSAPALDQLYSGPVPQSMGGVFERSVPTRSSGKSASAEDLLDHTGDRPITQHFRSRSSPIVDHYNKDFLAGDLRMFGIVSKEPPENRALGCGPPERLSTGSARAERNYPQNLGPSQANTPVVRRERSRHSDRPRAHSASGLAASVGLPCPFSPPGSRATGETQCQPNLDTITFPGTGTPGTSGTSPRNAARDDPSTTQKTAAPKTTSDFTPPHLEVQVPGSHAPFFSEPPPRSSHSGPPTSPKSPTSPVKPLLSLRISESSLHFAPPTSISQEENEVFFAPLSPSLPPPPPPPPSQPLPIRETDITEDLPLPCPPLTPQMKGEEPRDSAAPQELQRLNSVSEHRSVTTVLQQRDGQLDDVSSMPVASDPSSAPVISEAEAPQRPESGSVEKKKEEEEASDNPGLESPLLSRRERSAAEVKVEALARELVHRDEALAPLLDAWSSTSTLDLMEDIFPSRSSSLHQQAKSSSSSHPGDRAPAALLPADTPAKVGMETDLDEEESNLNQKKVELLQALDMSVAVLRGERASLAEEQQRYSALGCSMEALVQQRCKPNEKEKYRMFIGDLEKIVNLLLSLSGRLARVENALNALGKETDPDSAEERESLQQKRRQLCSQQEDARELKENLDRRERVVLDFLGGYLSPAQLRDYQRYVRAKPALLIRQRHLDELVRHGEEQLQRLSESVPPELRPQDTDSAFTSDSASNAPPAHSPRPTTVTSL